MSRKLSAFILALFLIFALSVPASANSAEPPGMIIIVEGAPEDMTLTLVPGQEPEYEIRIHESRRGWETYFRLYYGMDFSILSSAMIRVESSGNNFTCPIPAEAGRRYNSLLTLNYENRTLTLGQRWWRQPMLTAVRVALTLLVEGLLFFAFGFRGKRSWIVFLIVNLLTQGWLNYIINSSAFSNGYWVLGLYLAEFVIFIAEAIAFPMATKEKKKGRCVLYALAANAASLIAGLLLINHLPI